MTVTMQCKALAKCSKYQVEVGVQARLASCHIAV